MIEAAVQADVSAQKNDQGRGAESDAVFLLQNAFVQRETTQDELEGDSLNENGSVLKGRAHSLDHTVPIGAEELQLFLH